MDKKEDVYKTVNKPSPEILYKDRKSKFYAAVHPIASEDDVKLIVEELRKNTIRPTMFAMLGNWEPKKTYRANDDGEPNNSAGMPIYGQIQSFGVTNVLVTVTRIFGGTKLGVGGLIQAYKTAAQMALESAKIVTKTIKAQLRLQFEYPIMDLVMRTIKQKDLDIVSQKMELDCELVISVRLSESEEIFQLFDEMHGVDVIMMD